MDCVPFWGVASAVYLPFSRGHLAFRIAWMQTHVAAVACIVAIEILVGVPALAPAAVEAASAERVGGSGRPLRFFLYPPEFEAGTAPVSIYYRRFYEELAKHPQRTEDPTAAALFIPGIDLGCAFLWPEYAASGLAKENYERGDMRECFTTRDERLADFLAATPPLYNASRRPHLLLHLGGWSPHKEDVHQFPYYLVGAPSLSMRQRRRGVDIPWPTMPITVDPSPVLSESCDDPPPDRKRLLVFKGTNTHKTRKNLEALHNGDDIVVYLKNFKERASATDHSLEHKAKKEYAQLLRESEFALVPRGDNLFSIRFVDALSFGAIPVVLADDWVLPFDEILPYDDFVVRMTEKEWKLIPSLLRAPGAYSAKRRCEMRRAGIDAYLRYFRDIPSNIRGLLEILEKRDLATEVATGGLGQRKCVKKLGFYQCDQEHSAREANEL